MSNFIKPEDVIWKKVRYLKEPLVGDDDGPLTTWKYEFELPEPLASWDVFSYWESERIRSMEEHLEPGDILFDIGTEQGWCNLAYAHMVGPENMVLIEPTSEFWPNIRATWEKNFDTSPLAFYDGLLSNKTNDLRNTNPNTFKWWPDKATGDLIDRNKYQYIHQNDDNIPEMKVDDYVELTGIIPRALTMDTEGSELLILRGAEKTLKRHHPKLWVSIHPDMSIRDYGTTKGELLEYLEGLGYSYKHLATDHEEHYVFIHGSERIV